MSLFGEARIEGSTFARCTTRAAEPLGQVGTLAVVNLRTVSLTDCDFVTNQAWGVGGAVLHQLYRLSSIVDRRSQLTVTRCTFVDNFGVLGEWCKMSL